jgi:hypothetical protein
MSYIIVTHINIPYGVEMFSDAYPVAYERLAQIFHDNGLQDATHDLLPTGIKMISTFFDQYAYTNLMTVLETNKDYQDRAVYNEANGITQYNVYEGSLEGYNPV